MLKTHTWHKRAAFRRFVHFAYQEKFRCNGDAQNLRTTLRSTILHRHWIEQAFELKRLDVHAIVYDHFRFITLIRGNGIGVQNMQVVIIDAETSRELWFGEDCAKHCKIAPSTWRSYATQGRTPERVATILKKVPLWDAEEVKAWHAQRPGSSTQRANHHTPSANA